MTAHSFRRHLLAAACLLAGHPAIAQDAMPSNVSGSLGHVVAAMRARGGTPAGMTPHAAIDRAGRVRVQVHLTTPGSLSDIAAGVAADGGVVIGASAAMEHGLIDAWLPPGAVSALARRDGVRSITLARSAVHDIGSVTSQGVAVVRADKVAAQGDLGAGVTVGVLSDSYDRSPNPPNAAVDIASGDLPGTANRLGHTQPVVVVDDSVAGADEGRAMLQIIHDTVPAARLCFATSNKGVVTFAANILALADKKGPCRADVIVDDTYYLEEPFFDRGPIGAAVDTVAGQGVAYFASEGNFNPYAFQSGLHLIADTLGRQRRAADPIDLSTVPPALTAGGFHNFGSDRDIRISLPYTLATDAELDTQWNDAFDPARITTDLNVLVFDADGKYRAELSGIDVNARTGQALEGALLPIQIGRGDPQYRIVIARATTGTIDHTVRFRILDAFRHARPLGVGSAPMPSVFGHRLADGTIAVGATAVLQTIATEPFSSLGPGIVDFAADGSRLARPRVLAKPDIVAPDGVATTVQGFKAFFGTSASAPQAAGVAALLIAETGGRLDRDRDAIVGALQRTARPHPLLAGTITGGTVQGSRAVAAIVRGFFADDPKQFQIGYTGPPGVSVVSVTIDLAPSGLIWNPLSQPPVLAPVGFAAALVQLRPLPYPRADATFDIDAGAFTGGGALRFGFPFSSPVSAASQPGSGPLVPATTANPTALQGAVVTLTLSDGSTLAATLRDAIGRGYAADYGFGLIDAEAAYAANRRWHTADR